MREGFFCFRLLSFIFQVITILSLSLSPFFLSFVSSSIEKKSKKIKVAFVFPLSLSPTPRQKTRQTKKTHSPPAVAVAAAAAAAAAAFAIAAPSPLAAILPLPFPLAPPFVTPAFFGLARTFAEAGEEVELTFEEEDETDDGGSGLPSLLPPFPPLSDGDDATPEPTPALRSTLQNDWMLACCCC